MDPVQSTTTSTTRNSSLTLSVTVPSDCGSRVYDYVAKLWAYERKDRASGNGNKVPNVSVKKAVSIATDLRKAATLTSSPSLRKKALEETENVLSRALSTSSSDSDTTTLSEDINLTHEVVRQSSILGLEKITQQIFAVAHDNAWTKVGRKNKTTKTTYETRPKKIDSLDGNDMYSCTETEQVATGFVVTEQSRPTVHPVIMNPLVAKHLSRKGTFANVALNSQGDFVPKAIQPVLTSPPPAQFIAPKVAAPLPRQRPVEPRPKFGESSQANTVPFKHPKDRVVQCDYRRLPTNPNSMVLIDGTSFNCLSAWEQQQAILNPMVVKYLEHEAEILEKYAKEHPNVTKY